MANAIKQVINEVAEKGKNVKQALLHAEEKLIL